MNKAEFLLCEYKNQLIYLMIYEHTVIIHCYVRNESTYIPYITHGQIQSMLHEFRITAGKNISMNKFNKLVEISKPKRSKDIKRITPEQYLKIKERLKVVNWTYTQEPHDTIVNYRFEDNVFYEYPDKIIEFHEAPGICAGYSMTY